ncbi:hypothetical protein F4677DRAFT_417371 [Hypoxylon crocopeplum]|nr:hypothetical protein F4677DRAFT_417371 [Hypoxylon crocopeplum]
MTMLITLSPEASINQRKRTSLVVLVSILFAIPLLLVWLMLPRGQVTMWVKNSKSWSSEFKGPYTPTEELLILSSAFSVVVSVLLETLLLFALQNRSKQTKACIRYILYMILSANAALAFAAFLFTSFHSSMLAERRPSIHSSAILGGHGDQSQVVASTWDYDKNKHDSDDEGFPCGGQVASRWLSLLISIFSIMLLVSAWLDFRDQDQRELEVSRLDEEHFDEKRFISV